MAKVRRSTRKPHQVLGFVHADGMPFITPVADPGVVDNGLVFKNPANLLPHGARRAGFLAHDFRPGLIGLSTATHTGWLAVNETALWTPHTRHGFVAPPNKTLLLIGNGAAARWGYRKALRQGRDQILQHARAETSTRQAFGNAAETDRDTV
jgi:hypothetical protein